MSDPAPRFAAVFEEIQLALNQAEQVVTYLNNFPPPPLLRVAILNSLIVYLVSNVEEGVRLLLTTYISLIEDNIGDYAFISNELNITNIKSGADLLRKSVIPDSKIKAVDVLKAMLKCINNEAGFVLFKDQITDNRGNMRTKEITELAKRVGVPNIWKGVGARPEARDAFPDLLEAQIEQSVISRWNELFDERDLVVHRISQATGWGQTKIEPYFKFLETIMFCIAGVLRENVERLLQSAAHRSGDHAPVA